MKTNVFKISSRTGLMAQNFTLKIIKFYRITDITTITLISTLSFYQLVTSFILSVYKIKNCFLTTSIKHVNNYCCYHNEKQGLLKKVIKQILFIYYDLL